MRLPKRLRSQKEEHLSALYDGGLWRKFWPRARFKAATLPQPSADSGD
jgi:hypothetical protein